MRIRRHVGSVVVVCGAALGAVGCGKIAPDDDEKSPALGVDASTSSEADAALGSFDAGRPRAYCDGRSAPSGVSDYLCASFDSQQLDEGWSGRTRTDAGLAEQTSLVARSAPFSFLAATMGDASETLWWRKTGAQAITGVTAIVHLDPRGDGERVPISEGTLALVRIAAASGVPGAPQAYFGFSAGALEVRKTLFFGYFVTTWSDSTDSASTRLIIPQLPSNVWTEVKIVWETTNQLNVFYNDTNVLSMPAPFFESTSATVTIGAETVGQVGVVPAHRFDDIELSIRR
jgi:hypothetical protein